MRSEVAPTAPTVEHLTSALGIGIPRPRLSWQLPLHFGPQHAYELEITGDAGSHWGERVDSSLQTLVPWTGPSLESRERRDVRVRVFNHRGTPSAWSAPTHVEAGLLARDDWRAQYIASSEVLDRPILLRKHFQLDGPVEKARLYLSYRGMGEPRLNGAVVSEEVLAPGWQSYSHRELYCTLDVTDNLQQGINELEVLLGDGWYRGRLGFLQQRALYGDQVALLAQLEIERDGVRQMVVVSDASWHWATDATLASSLYDGEQYDAREDPAAQTEDSLISRWRSVEVLEAPIRTLEAPLGPPVRRTELVPAKRIFTSPSGRVLVDFGQNVVGRLRVRVEGPTGTTITLRHAEVLEDGELGVRPLRSAAATDSYILRGGGPERWEPRFTYHGFRYAQIDGWPGGAPSLADVEAVVLHSDMTRTGWFDSSNEDLNRLHENVVWSMRGNFVSIPTDCPQRDERLGWTGDISVFGPTATYLFDCVGMLSSWLRDLALEQRADGIVPFFVPDVPFPPEVKDVPGLAPSHTAVWGDAAVLVPFALYRASGDLEVLEQQYESMRRWVDGVAALVGDRLVWDEGFQFGDWLDPVAPPDDPAAGATETALVATAYFANSIRLLARAAALTDREEDRGRYEALGEAVATAFRDRFLRSDHRLSSDTQTAYAIAICLDLLPDPESRGHAGDRLSELVREAGHRIATGFVGTALVLDALALTDSLEDAYALLLQTECPSWLYPVRMGATTVWERWDSMLPDGTINPGEMTSFNHYALGAVADWLHRVVGGLSSDVPGWSRLRIAPRPTRSLTYASTSHLTPYGLAEVRWRLEGDLLLIEATVPDGSTALVDLPAEEPWQLGPGTHRIERVWRGVDDTVPALSGPHP